MLYGVPELDPSGNYYNSVMSIGTGPAQTYRKHHLVPFGDYFPLRPVLGWIMNLLHIPMSDFSSGAQVQKPMQVDGQKVAVKLCYEDVFGEKSSVNCRKRTMLANFHNEACGAITVASRQHLQIRADAGLETGRPMLRAPTPAVTAIIILVADCRICPGIHYHDSQRPSARLSGSTPYIVLGNTAFLVLRWGCS